MLTQIHSDALKLIRQPMYRVPFGSLNLDGRIARTLHSNQYSNIDQHHPNALRAEILAVAATIVDLVSTSILLLSCRVLRKEKPVGDVLQSIGLLAQVEDLGSLMLLDDSIWRALYVASAIAGGPMMRQIAWVLNSRMRLLAKGKDCLTDGQFTRAATAIRMNKAELQCGQQVDSFLYLEELGLTWFVQQRALKEHLTTPGLIPHLDPVYALTQSTPSPMKPALAPGSGYSPVKPAMSTTPTAAGGPAKSSMFSVSPSNWFRGNNAANSNAATAAAAMQANSAHNAAKKPPPQISTAPNAALVAALTSVGKRVAAFATGPAQLTATQFNLVRSSSYVFLGPCDGAHPISPVSVHNVAARLESACAAHTDEKHESAVVEEDSTDNAASGSPLSEIEALLAALTARVESVQQEAAIAYNKQPKAGQDSSKGPSTPRRGSASELAADMMMSTAAGMMAGVAGVAGVASVATVMARKSLTNFSNSSSNNSDNNSDTASRSSTKSNPIDSTTVPVAVPPSPVGKVSSMFASVGAAMFNRAAAQASNTLAGAVNGSGGGLSTAALQAATTMVATNASSVNTPSKQSKPSGRRASRTSKGNKKKPRRRESARSENMDNYSDDSGDGGNGTKSDSEGEGDDDKDEHEEEEGGMIQHNTSFDHDNEDEEEDDESVTSKDHETNSLEIEDSGARNLASDLADDAAAPVVAPAEAGIEKVGPDEGSNTDSSGESTEAAAAPVVDNANGKDGVNELQQNQVPAEPVSEAAVTPPVTSPSKLFLEPISVDFPSSNPSGPPVDAASTPTKPTTPISPFKKRAVNAATLQAQSMQLLQQECLARGLILGLHSQTPCGSCGYSMMDEEILAALITRPTVTTSYANLFAAGTGTAAVGPSASALSPGSENPNSLRRASGLRLGLTHEHDNNPLLCPNCATPFMPQIHVRTYRVNKEFDSTSQSGSVIDLDADYSRSVPYVSPTCLRIHIEQLIEKIGDNVVDAVWLHAYRPDVFWTLVWFCNRLNLPTGMLCPQQCEQFAPSSQQSASNNTGKKRRRSINQPKINVNDYLADTTKERTEHSNTDSEVLNSLLLSCVVIGWRESTAKQRVLYLAQQLLAKGSVHSRHASRADHSSSDEETDRQDDSSDSVAAHSAATKLPLSDIFPGCSPEDEAVLNRACECMDGSIAGMRRGVVEFAACTPAVTACAQITGTKRAARNLYIGLLLLCAANGNVHMIGPTDRADSHFPDVSKDWLYLSPRFVP
jgi:hypothetical protein